MNKIEGCEVCGGGQLLPVLDLGRHPMCDDLVPVGNGRIPADYPISIVFCPICRTAHQEYQIPKQTLFPTSYHYRARHTADVLGGMRELVERCRAELGELGGRSVLDIGCNDGSLLSIFAENEMRTAGVEPTGAAEDAEQAGHRVYRAYLTPELAQTIVSDRGHPDIITFTNVFAHIEDLPSVIVALKTLAGPRTLLVIENHYLGAVLDRYQFDTFYHEHPRTYSLTSFRRIAQSLGAKLVGAEFPKRYGGNIRVLMNFDELATSQAPAEVDRLAAIEEDFDRRLLDMGRRIPLWRAAKRSLLASVVASYGPISGKAFPGRAAILVKLLGLNNTMITGVYEKPGSMKVGHYLPGTRIPILSDADFPERPNTEAPLLNLAWHISSEIRGYMKRQGFDGEIVDLFSPEEFDRLTQ